jgi:hypothetical protein
LILSVVALAGLVSAALPWGFLVGFALLGALFTVASYKWACNLVRGALEVASARLQGSPERKLSTGDARQSEQ